VEEREGGRGKAPRKRHRPWGKRKDTRERENRGGREIGFPKDLCANLENCKDLCVKPKFLINLKP
jgi:hypothetical protein